ncbi:chlorobenzene dihydrodiol dehydrogenase-like [Clavelina lepadiformis]
MVDCSNKVALVLGGAGNVGSGVVGGFLRRGYGRVAVISRDPVRLDNLRKQAGDAHERIVCILGDVGSERSAEAARQEVIKQCGRVDDIVTAIGFSWWQKGPVAQQSKTELESTLNSLVVAPFVAYKTFIPLVKDNPNGSYTFVTGGGADMYLIPGTGFMAVGGGAAQGLARAGLKEHVNDPVCVTEICFMLGVTPVPDQMPPAFTWIFNQDAGDAISMAAMKRAGRGKTSVIESLDGLKRLAENGVL